MRCKIDLILDDYLKSNNISRNELSRKTGISYQQLQGYWNNVMRRLDVFTLERICDALDCELMDILKLTRE